MVARTVKTALADRSMNGAASLDPAGSDAYTLKKAGALAFAAPDTFARMTELARSNQ